MMTRGVTSVLTVTLKFTTDLPNGSYVVQDARNKFDVYINQNGSTLLDVKNTMETFVAECAAKNAQNPHRGHYKSTFAVESVSYKGGDVGFETSLEHMKDGDQIQITCLTKVSASPCIIL